MRRARVFVLSVLAFALVAPPVSAEVLDPTYGWGGRTRATYDDHDPLGMTFGIIDAGGRAVQTGPGRSGTGRVVRLDENGLLDQTFGSGGEAVLPQSIAWRIEAVPGHGVAVGGVTKDANGHTVYYVKRFTEAGQPDSRFGSAGVLGLELNESLPIAMGPDGQLLVSRRIHDPNTSWIWELYLESGEKDPTFDGSVLRGAYRPGDGVLDEAVAFDPDGGIVFISSESCTVGPCAAVRRLLPDGRVDDTFAGDGAAELPAAGSTFALDVDGTGIVAARQASDGTTTIWRFAGDGDTDPQFDGPVVWDLPNPGGLQVEALALGRTVVTSGSTAGTAQDVVVLVPNGLPEPAFEFGIRSFAGRSILGAGDGGVPGRLILARLKLDDVSVVSRFSLEEGGLPAPNVTAVTPRPTGATVTWESPEALADEAVSYLVLLMRGTKVAGQAHVAGDVREVSIAGLVSGEYYEANVIAYTRRGQGPISESALVVLDNGAQAATAPAGVADLVVTPGTREVRASWSPGADNGSPITAYSVIAVDKQSGQLAGWRNVAADVRSVVLDGLGHHRAYDLHVFAWNAQGIGAATPVATTTNSANLGGAPSVPWASATRAATATYVSWGAPIEHGEPIVGFDVLVIENGAWISWTQVGPDKRQLTLPKLKAGSDAQIYVFAHGASGFGPVGAPATP